MPLQLRAVVTKLCGPVFYVVVVTQHVHFFHMLNLITAVIPSLHLVFWLEVAIFGIMLFCLFSFHFSILPIVVLPVYFPFICNW